MHGEAEGAVERENGFYGGFGVEAPLSEGVPDGFAKVVELFAERPWIEAFARLISAIERGNHCQLAERFRLLARVLGCRGGIEEGTRQRALALAPHILSRLSVRLAPEAPPPLGKDFREYVVVGEAIHGVVHAMRSQQVACRVRHRGSKSGDPSGVGADLAATNRFAVLPDRRARCVRSAMLRVSSGWCTR